MLTGLQLKRGVSNTTFDRLSHINLSVSYQTRIYKLNPTKFEEISKGIIAGDGCSEAMRKWPRSQGGNAIETSLKLNPMKFEEICKGIIPGDRCSEAMRKWPMPLIEKSL